MSYSIARGNYYYFRSFLFEKIRRVLENLKKYLEEIRCQKNIFVLKTGAQIKYA